MKRIWLTLIREKRFSVIGMVLFLVALLIVSLSDQKSWILIGIVLGVIALLLIALDPFLPKAKK